MTGTQFRVLYREFLFRVVDRELLSTYAQGDMSKLLLRFVSLLISLGLVYALPAALLSQYTPPKGLLLLGWYTIGSLMATTMLTVGLFTVLSWNTIYPDRLDALVLTPLPVRRQTIFLAKIAALASGLGIAVLALNAAPSLLWPLRLYSALSTLGEAPNVIRMIVAYWITVIAASLFIACLVIGLQGLAAMLLPRPAFLRVSSYLQLGTFIVVISTYLLLPAAATPAYWFLSVFQQLSGLPHNDAVVPFAWWGVGVTLGWTAVAYTVSYFRTLRKIAEESDIAKRSRGAGWWPRVGSARQTAIAHFAVRTLIRSNEHRVLLAFYWGLGFAITTVFLALAYRGIRTPVTLESLWHERSVPLIVSSVVMLMASILGARVVFALPRDLRANWIFRITPLRGGAEYLGARRRALFVASVLPVWLLAAVVFFVCWPPVPAAGHLLLLWLLGSTLVELYLYGTRKIPFTCSYLPGKSTFQAAFWVAVLALLGLTAFFGRLERRALDSPVVYAQLAGALGAVWLVARAITSMRASGVDSQPQFEEEPADRIVSLNVWDHRFAAGVKERLP